MLAGSAAYALGEVRRWPIGLARKPKEAKAFYATIVVSTLVGTAIAFSPLDPIKALFWSGVLNGVVAVRVMAMMMLMAANKNVMGKFAIAGTLRGSVGSQPPVMAAAALVMGVASLI